MFRKLIPVALGGLLVLGTSAFAQNRTGHAAPAVHHSAPVVRAPAVHFNAPAVHHNAPVVHRTAPVRAPAVVNRNANVVHRSAPAIHNSTIHRNAPAFRQGPIVRNGYYNHGYYGIHHPIHHLNYGYNYALPYYYSPYYGYNNAYVYPDYSDPAYSAPYGVTDAAPAQLHILLPDPQAKVWVNGNFADQTGTDRRITTQLIPAGTSFTFQIRASWMEGYSERTVVQTVEGTPGGTFVVDFTRPVNGY